MKQKESRQKRKRRRAVPFLPNFITTLGMFFGFYGILFSLHGNFTMAAVMILVAGFADGLDGRVARATNSQSAFGKEYDSLSDVIAFGVSPAILIYLWALQPFDRYGFLASFLFVACGALRLARFNSDTSGNLHTFTGLPIPAAAASIASIVLLSRVLGDIPAVPVLVWVYVLSFMMVSTIAFPSFKHLDYVKAHPFQLLVASLLLLVVVASAPEVMLFVLTTTYICCGTLYYVARNIKARKKTVQTDEGTEHEIITGKDSHI